VRACREKLKGKERCCREKLKGKSVCLPAGKVERKKEFACLLGKVERKRCLPAGKSWKEKVPEKLEGKGVCQSRKDEKACQGKWRKRCACRGRGKVERKRGACRAEKVAVGNIKRRRVPGQDKWRRCRGNIKKLKGKGAPVGQDERRRCHGKHKKEKGAEAR
jgi:hypothetical protein